MKVDTVKENRVQILWKNVQGEVKVRWRCASNCKSCR